jgi:hypothetical protein
MLATVGIHLAAQGGLRLGGDVAAHARAQADLGPPVTRVLPMQRQRNGPKPAVLLAGSCIRGGGGRTGRCGKAMRQ